MRELYIYEKDGLKILGLILIVVTIILYPILSWFIDKTEIIKNITNTWEAIKEI